MTDRIELFYEGPLGIDEVLEGFGDYVRVETLAEAIRKEEPEEGAHVESHKLEGWNLR